MLKEIQVYEHCSTHTFYATCSSTKYGECTQWGKTADEAIERLRQFTSQHWSEPWPEVERLEKTPEPHPGETSA